MDLVIDKGNTRIKYAIFKNESLHEKAICSSTELGELLERFSGEVSRMILSSVSPVDAQLRTELQKCCSNHFILSSTTSVPFTNQYETPSSLGADRLALAAGAMFRFPETNALIIDLGTCMTFDFIDKQSNYLGGAIAPGLQMRLKALNAFTAKLPLITAETPQDLIGKNTKESILSGVVNGMINELEGTIEAYKLRYPIMKVILTGGDLPFFDKKLKNGIFADEDILLNGMYFILKHHANKNL
ncbi:MAG: type III pantothenate kinase [Flavobacteriales bacterium]|nr:type III pantothenate kinase [Flavobacteriales bacterium]